MEQILKNNSNAVFRYYNTFVYWSKSEECWFVKRDVYQYGGHRVETVDRLTDFDEMLKKHFPDIKT